MDDSTGWTRALPILALVLWAVAKRIERRRDPVGPIAELESGQGITGNAVNIAALPWGVTSAADTAEVKGIKILWNEGRYLRCEQLVINDREVVRTTEIDALGRALGPARLQAGDLDEEIGKLI